jgi:hypothetical protein
VAEQRYEVVRAVIADGETVTDVAARCPHQLAAVAEVWLVELRGLHPGWGADRLRYRLE